MKEIHLPKTEAFFEGFPLILFNLGIKIEDGFLVYDNGEETKRVSTYPCNTPAAAIASLQDAYRNGYIDWDESEQFPNFAAVLSYWMASAGLTMPTKDIDDKQLVPRSISYYVNSLASCFSTIYVHHYKLNVTAEYVHFLRSDYATILPAGFQFDPTISGYKWADGPEHGAGMYKIEAFDKVNYNFLGNENEWEEPLTKGETYDVYIYSTLPELDFNFEEQTSYNVGCTFTEVDD